MIADHQSVTYATHEQVIACIACQAIDEVPDYAFPQVPGVWANRCPECGERWVVVSEVKPRERGEMGESER